MKLFLIILFFSAKTFSQDSVTAKVIKTSEKTVVYKIGKDRFVSFDCSCDTLKRGMEFKIPKSRFDSLLKEARPIRRKEIYKFYMKKVICINDGSNEPNYERLTKSRIKNGEVYDVLFERMDEILFYELNIHPNWLYPAYLFAPLSEIDETEFVRNYNKELA